MHVAEVLSLLAGAAFAVVIALTLRQVAQPARRAILLAVAGLCVAMLAGYSLGHRQWLVGSLLAVNTWLYCRAANSQAKKATE